MGTNYYWHPKPPCECCGREFESKHIGKSSAGWCFSLHVYPDEGIRDLQDWSTLWIDGVIKDEYGVTITKDDMLKTITERRRKIDDWAIAPHGYSSWREFHAENHSQQGPNGMLRHQIDGRHCTGHGAGTWDLLESDFS